MLIPKLVTSLETYHREQAGLYTSIIAGVILIVLGGATLGGATLGGAIKFNPTPVVTGFTSGIAVIIFSGELRDFFGLRMPGVPADFLAKIQAYTAHMDSVTPWAVAVAGIVHGVTLLLITLFFGDIDEALARARVILGPAKG